MSRDPYYDDGDEQQGQDDSGYHAGDKELGYRLLGHDAVNNKETARGDENAESAAGGDGAGSQGVVVLVVPHLRYRDKADGEGAGDAGGADGREDPARKNRRHRQTAGEPAREGVGKAKQGPAETGVEYDRPHEAERGAVRSSRSWR